MNVVPGKQILENYWNRLQGAIDGKIDVYTYNEGFTYASCPAMMTIDLGKLCSLSLIRFLLWDKDNRVYQYRLLISTVTKTTTGIVNLVNALADLQIR